MPADIAQDVASDAKRKVQSHFDEMKVTAGELRDDLRRLKSEVASLVGSLVGTGKDGSVVAKEKLSATAAVARDRLSEGTERLEGVWEQAKTSSADAVESLEASISSNPLAALAIAAGVGLIAGALLRRH